MAENAVIEQARAAVAQLVKKVDEEKPIGLVVIFTNADGKTAWSFSGYSPETAHHLTERFAYWQLSRLAKLDLMREAQAETAAMAQQEAAEAKPLITPMAEG